jgi:hypothetical protein
MKTDEGNRHDEVTDGCARYRVAQVEQRPHERAFGHAWVELIESAATV